LPTIAVNLTEELDRFVRTCIETGRYKDSNHVIQTALRVLELEEQQYEVKLQALRAAIEEGEASGIFEGDPFEYVRSQRTLRSKQSS